MLDVMHEVEAAVNRIRPYLRRTYLEPSPVYSARTGANVWFKCENLQHTGSFKARGAVNKVMWLSDAARARGVTTASTGNHGAAVAFALGQLDARGIVFVPTTADPAKVRMIEALGAEVRALGDDCVEAEAVARQYADEHGMTYISPYNDPQIVGGQGTIGAELAEQLNRIDAVFVSLGGGGLISGIAGYLKHARPGVQVIGCSPENSRVMIESVRAGAILDLPSLPTLSDGTAGGVEAGSITFDLCRELVDSYVTVTEGEIAASLRDFMGAHHMLIEGSAAVAIAAFVRRAEEFAGKNVVIVLCGANISLETLCEVL
jgi:threonine dehydratase